MQTPSQPAGPLASPMPPLRWEDHRKKRIAHHPSLPSAPVAGGVLTSHSGKYLWSEEQVGRGKKWVTFFTKFVVHWLVPFLVYSRISALLEDVTLALISSALLC